MGALDKLRVTADNLLSKFGKKMIYYKFTNGVYNPVTSQNENTSEAIPIIGHIDTMKSGDIKDDLLESNDIVVLVSDLGLGVEVSNTDKIEIDNIIYQVKYNIPLWSGSLKATHRVVCKIS